MALQNIEANITLDLYDHDTTPSTVKAIQLDSQTRYVAARLQNMGAQYDVDSGATVQLIVIRPDKVGVQITGTTFAYGDEGASFLGPYAELTQVALAVNGKMRGQFKITSGNQILRTEIFAISTGEALDASTDEWADEYDGYNLEEMATSIETNTADIATLEADVSQIKEDLNNNVLSPNLMGMDKGFKYPVYIPQGSRIRISTSDGSILPTSNTLRLNTYDKDGVYVTYYGVNTGLSYKVTGAVSKDIYYLAWNEDYATPLMVNASEGTPEQLTYVPYFSAPKKIASDLLTLNGRTNDAVKDITGCRGLTYTRGYYIDLSTDTIDINAQVASSAWGYVVDTCQAGDIYNVKGYGSNLGRLWGFYNSSGQVIKRATSTTVATEYSTLVAPADSAYFVSNSNFNKIEGVAVKGALPVSNTAEFTYSASDFDFGLINSSGIEKPNKSFMVTKDYIPKSAKGLRIVDSTVKVCIAVWDGIAFGRNYWITTSTPIGQSGYQVAFDSAKKYKIYIAKSDESQIIDADIIAKSVRVIFDTTYDAEHRVQSHADQTAVMDKLRIVMRNNYNIAYANAANYIDFNNVYGNNQNVHPKVLYFANGFGGHLYWMAYTPYPWGTASYENPCIAFSDDGYEWTDIDGNPIDEPDSGVTGYMSDTHLVYKDGVLECWYRLADTENLVEYIYRKTSSDGVTWSSREELYSYTSESSVSHALSPCALWDGTKYQIWLVYYSYGSTASENNQYIKYFESADGTNWTQVSTIKIPFALDNLAYRLWHIDVIKDGNNYVLLAMCKGGGSAYDGTANQVWTLFMTTSADNVTYSTPLPVILGSTGWDKYMYRASIVKSDVYRIYYSALDDMSAHHIGISESDTLADFIGR